MKLVLPFLAIFFSACSIERNYAEEEAFEKVYFSVEKWRDALEKCQISLLKKDEKKLENLRSKAKSMGFKRSIKKIDEHPHNATILYSCEAKPMRSKMIEKIEGLKTHIEKLEAKRNK